MDKRHDLQVSRHGERRTRQRVGLPRKAVERNARKALTEGIGYDDAKGNLRDYIYWLYKSHGHGNNIRIYNDFVYVFQDEILVTVLNVPPEHRKAAKGQQTKRKG